MRLIYMDKNHHWLGWILLGLGFRTLHLHQGKEGGISLTSYDYFGSFFGVCSPRMMWAQQREPMSGGLGLGRRDHGARCLLGLFAYVRVFGRPVAMEKRWGTVCQARLTFSPSKKQRRLSSCSELEACCLLSSATLGQPRPPTPGRNPKVGRKPQMKVGKEQRARGEAAGRWASAHGALWSDGARRFSGARRPTCSGHLWQQGKFSLDMWNEIFPCESGAALGQGPEP